MPGGEESGLVEIPRFKKRELNLAIVRGSGPWRLAWYAIWTWWLLNAMAALVGGLSRT